jgi:predicted amidophosphoribosyltransferase
MSQQHNAGQLLADLGQVMAGLCGALLSSRTMLRDRGQHKLELLARRLPIATRADYEALHDGLKKARQEQQSLQDRALEQNSVRSAADNVRTKG